MTTLCSASCQRRDYGAKCVFYSTHHATSLSVRPSFLSQLPKPATIFHRVRHLKSPIMAKTISDLPQELIDKILCYTLDDAEFYDQATFSASPATQLYDVLKARRVCRKFKSAFENGILSARGSNVWMQHWTPPSESVRTANAGLAFMSVFKARGKRLQVYLDGRLTGLVGPMVEAVRWLVSQCKQVEYVKLILVHHGTAAEELKTSAREEILGVETDEGRSIMIEMVEEKATAT